MVLAEPECGRLCLVFLKLRPVENSSVLIEETASLKSSIDSINSNIIPKAQRGIKRKSFSHHIISARCKWH